MLDIDPLMVYKKAIPLARTVSVQEVDTMDNEDINIVDVDLTQQPNLEKKFLNLHLILRTISSLEKLTKKAEFGSTLRSIVSSNSQNTFDQETNYEIIQNGFFLFISSLLSALIFYLHCTCTALSKQVSWQGIHLNFKPYYLC